MDEATLIAAAQRGDDHAFATLLAKYRGMIAKVCKPYFLPGADKDEQIFVEQLMDGIEHLLAMLATDLLAVALQLHDRNREGFRGQLLGGQLLGWHLLHRHRIWRRDRAVPLPRW